MFEEPVPRDVELELEPWSTPTIGATIDLPIRPSWPTVNFVDVLARRRSTRPMLRPDIPQLSDLLWCSVKTIDHAPGKRRYQRRPAPSGGGLHPIDLVIMNGPESQSSVWHYDAIEHSLRRVQVGDPLALPELRDLQNRVLDRSHPRIPDAAKSDHL